MSSLQSNRITSMDLYLIHAFFLEKLAQTLATVTFVAFCLKIE